MLIEIGCDIEFVFPEPTAVILMLSLHPLRAPTIRRHENLHVTPSVPISYFFDTNGNRCGRRSFRQATSRFATTQSSKTAASRTCKSQAPRKATSRICRKKCCSFFWPAVIARWTANSKQIAWSLFSQTTPGWPRVQAVCDFVHRHIRFDYQQARANRTALEVYREGVGVCRDYMHLAITFCRCLNVPARYCTGYLGDIGVPLAPYPMDFSAWFEAYLGGQWYAFDARNNTPRIGRVSDGPGARCGRRRDDNDVRSQSATDIQGLDRGSPGGLFACPSRRQAYVGQA